MKKFVINILVGLVAGIAIFVLGKNYVLSLTGSIIVFCTFVFVINKEEPKKVYERQEKPIPEKIEASMVRLQESVPRIMNVDLKKQLEKLLQSISPLLEALKDKPNSADALRKLANHYLPDLVNILIKFERSEKAYPENAEKIFMRVEAMEKACKNLLKQIYADDTLAITTTLRVLDTGMLSDGAIEPDNPFREGEQQ